MSAEKQVVVVFDIADGVGREAAAHAIVGGLNGWQDGPIAGGCESWWIADGDLKHVDRNDNRAMQLVDDDAWYESHDNLSVLLAWLGDMSPSGFRDVVKDPWDYEVEWVTAKAALAHEAETGHEVWHAGQSDTVAYCNDEDCGWQVDHGVVTAVEAVRS